MKGFTQKARLGGSPAVKWAHFSEAITDNKYSYYQSITIFMLTDIPYDYNRKRNVSA